MTELTGTQRKYLRGLAHNLEPVVLIGQKGLTDSVIESVDQALTSHELIKIKFNEYKEKEMKNRLLDELSAETDCARVGMIGHVAVLYRPHPDPDKRRIALP